MFYFDARENWLGQYSPPPLAAGSVGIVVDSLEGGEAYLVEFGSRGPDQCDWLGVLYASEIELMAAVAKAA